MNVLRAFHLIMIFTSSLKRGGGGLNWVFWINHGYSHLKLDLCHVRNWRTGLNANWPPHALSVTAASLRGHRNLSYLYYGGVSIARRSTAQGEGSWINILLVKKWFHHDDTKNLLGVNVSILNRFNSCLIYSLKIAFYRYGITILPHVHQAALSESENISNEDN